MILEPVRESSPTGGSECTFPASEGGYTEPGSDRGPHLRSEWSQLGSHRECGSADESALKALLATFESIDVWDTHGGHGRAPRPDEQLVLSA